MRETFSFRSVVCLLIPNIGSTCVGFSLAWNYKLG
jgi:hypothetical protein